MEPIEAKERINVMEINSVVAERTRKESRERRLGAWERGGKTMLLGIIGVALVSMLGSGGKHRSLVEVVPRAVGEGIQHAAELSTLLRVLGGIHMSKNIEAIATGLGIDYVYMIDVFEAGTAGYCCVDL